MKTVNIALLGYGNAARAFCKLLAEKDEEIKKNYGREVKIVAIATKSKGTVSDPAGLDICALEKELEETGVFVHSVAWEALDVVMKADYDVLLELTPLHIFSGQPATDHIRLALQRKKHVVSANKGPIAWAFAELKEMAEENQCCFFYETTVMDGTPVFNLAQRTLPMCKVTKIEGILNTTTNFILEEMAKGIPHEEIMAEGRRRGFVEADPSLDVDGWDAAAKVTALMNVLMDARITPLDIQRQGIGDISAEAVQEAARRGKRIKLVCGGTMEGGKPVGYVRPVELDAGDLLASITGTSSVVSLTTDLMGKVTIVEHAPEIEQTAYGIFSDLLRVLEAGLSTSLEH